MPPPQPDADSTIQAVDVVTVAVPLARPIAFSTRVVHERHYVLVRITTADGVRGLGFCYAGHTAGRLGAIAITDLLGPILLGQQALGIESLWERMYRDALLHGRTGVVMRALSACDIALWDRNAKAAGLSLWRHLGGGDPTVRAYASGGYYRNDDGPDELAREMRGYVEAGFTAVKLKVGRFDPALDAERIAICRQAVGPAGLVMLDANNAFNNLPDALAALEKWEPYHPYWIEEPFSPDNIAEHARLARHTSVPVATGEIEAGRWRFLALLTQNAAAVLQPDAAVCGGITEFRRIAATASAFGVSVCPHWFHDLHAHLVAATPNATFVEYFPTADVLNFRLLIDEQLDTVGGHLQLSDRHGLGFDFDEESVDRYSQDGWSEVSRLSTG